MPVGLDPADRKLLFGALALMLLMTVLTGTLAPPATQEQSPVPSSYSSSPGGALAAYTLLAQLHYPVTRWEETPAALPLSVSRAVLILAEPAGTPSIKERVRLRAFVAGGGRILFCGKSLPTFFPDAPLNQAASPKPLEVAPDFPSALTRGAKKVRIAPQASWETIQPSQIALYGAESAPVIVVWRIGRGELLWWSAATPLTNAEVNKADDLTLLLNAVALSTGSPQSIYWDEYFHGGRGSLWSYVERTPLQWACLQCALLICAILFAFSRRSGPIAGSRPVSRLSPLEFVETLGGLYQRAGATSVPVGVAYRHLRLAVARRLRLSPALSDKDLAEVSEQRLGWEKVEFTSALEMAAASQQLPSKQALRLVQTLGHYLQRLADYSPKLEKR